MVESVSVTLLAEVFIFLKGTVFTQTMLAVRLLCRSVTSVSGRTSRLWLRGMIIRAGRDHP